MNKKHLAIFIATGATIFLLIGFLSSSLVSCKRDFRAFTSKKAPTAINNNLSIAGVSNISNTQYAKIELEYPQLAGVSEAFNLEISNYINERLSQFNKNSEDNWKARFETKSAGDDIGEFPRESEKFTLMSDWKLEQMNSDRVSLILTVYEYSGGAHGSTIMKSFNYDVKTQKNITLADLFKGDDNYLNKVSDYTIADLKQQLVGNGMSSEESIKEGAGPRLENFETFTLSRNKITFYFGQYSVGAYAIGIRSVDMYI